MRFYLTLFLLLAGYSFTFAQFRNQESVEIQECDCKDQLSYLDVDVILPDNYHDYNYIQFVIYKNDIPFNVINRRTNRINDSRHRLSILSPANQGKRTFYGAEYGLYRGNDFYGASYNNLCEGSGQSKVKVKAFGIKQISTEYETDYDVNRATGRVTARTRPVAIYDKGEIISETSVLTINQDKHEKVVRLKNSINLQSGIIYGSFFLGYIGVLIAGSL